MTDSHSESRPLEAARPPARHPGRRAALVLALLAVTLGAGAASRRAQRPPVAMPPVSATDGRVSLEAELDRGAVLRGSDGLVRMEVVLRGGPAAANAQRTPTDLVVLLDRSGSMAGGALETAAAAVHELISGLASGDRFALVSYASDVQVDIALEPALPARREAWDRAVASIGANGGTNLSAGLDTAHTLLAGAQRSGRAARLIVLSDGLANQGDYSLEGLRGRAARALGDEYVLSSVGIGDGFDETVMSALADAGTGNFYYLPDMSRLAGVFSDEFAAARETVARALAVRFTPAPGVRVASAGGLPLQGEASEGGSGAVRFHPGDLFAGQVRRVWLTLHVPTGELGTVDLGGLDVEFTASDGDRHRLTPAALPELACVGAESDYYASFASDSYRRANIQESLGTLKQSVARKVAGGRRAEAIAELDDYQARNTAEQQRALGSVIEDEVQAVDALRDLVASPAAAEPAARNRLGKSLLESGRDDQRAGAKR